MKRFIVLCAFALLIFAGLSMPTISSAKTKSIATPTNVRARNSAYKRLKVKWKKVKKADGYQIYEYKAAKKKYVKVADVGAKVTSWKSKNTKKEHTYKVRAYRKSGKNRIYSKFSYEVSALPYKKNAKKVNAGFISFSEAYLDLSIYERKTISVKLKKSSYAKNKNAKVYDETIRFSSSDKSIAKVDSEGNIITQGKEGKCKIYARAHNGNLSWIEVDAENYAKNVKFDNVDAMVGDMRNMINNHQTDLEQIAAFFQEYKAKHPNEKTQMKFILDDDRKQIVSEIISGNSIQYEKIEGNMMDVLQSCPGLMEINVEENRMTFVMYGSKSYAKLIFLFYTPKSDFNETNNYFSTADRWVYYYFNNAI